MFWLLDLEDKVTLNGFREVPLQQNVATLPEILTLVSPPPMQEEVVTLPEMSTESMVDNSLTLVVPPPLQQEVATLPEMSRESLISHSLSNELSGEEILVTIDDQNITREAMRCLQPERWLNSDVINPYLCLLKLREDHNPACLPCHFFDTFFYKCLVSKGVYKFRDWTKHLKYNILDCHRVFVPIHHTNRRGEDLHWSLAMIDLKAKNLQYFDSLHKKKPKILKYLAKYIDDEAEQRSLPSLNARKWDHFSPENVPRQEDGHNCGLFLLRFAEELSIGASLNFNIRDSDGYREEVVVRLINRRVP